MKRTVYLTIVACFALSLSAQVMDWRHGKPGVRVVTNETDSVALALAMSLPTHVVVTGIAETVVGVATQGLLRAETDAAALAALASYAATNQPTRIVLADQIIDATGGVWRAQQTAVSNWFLAATYYGQTATAVVSELSYPLPDSFTVTVSLPASDVTVTCLTDETYDHYTQIEFAASFESLWAETETEAGFDATDDLNLSATLYYAQSGTAVTTNLVDALALASDLPGLTNGLAAGAAAAAPDAPSSGAILGDSTVSAYAGAAAVADYLLLPADAVNGSTITNLAAPGHTTAQQYAVWTDYPAAARSNLNWVAIQSGLNDLIPSANITNVVSGYQALVDRVRLDAPRASVCVSTMTPARQRYVNVYGPSNGAKSYALWLALNQAVSGGGALAITNVHVRASGHTSALDDGTGSLAAVYDTGDAVHENDAARAIVAAEIRRALNLAGVLLPAPPAWYRDADLDARLADVDERLTAGKLDALDGTAYALTARGGITMWENDVRIFPAWTNGVPVLAVTVDGSNYVFALAEAVGLSTTAPAWYDGLGLSSVWPVTDGIGTNLADAVGSVTARTVGGASWATFGGAQCLALDGSGYASIGDAYDPGTNSFMIAAWFALTNTPASTQGIVSKNAGSPYEIGLYVANDRKVSSFVRNNAGGSILGLPGPTALATGVWHHAALVVTRGVGSAIIVDGQTYASSTNHLAGWDLQSSAHMLFGYRNIAKSYLLGYYGSMQVDIGPDVTTNAAVGVWSASKSIYGY